MAMHYENLDLARVYMVAEVESDHTSTNLYMSPRLNDAGAKAWPALLKEACERHEEDWLANMLLLKSALRSHELRQGKSVKVPVTAHNTLAQGEFNRFYIRGLCLHCRNVGQTHVEVYRAMSVKSPRAESQAAIGQLVPVKELLADLRTNIGIDTFLKLPAGPNSGLSVRLAVRDDEPRQVG